MNQINDQANNSTLPNNREVTHQPPGNHSPKTTNTISNANSRMQAASSKQIRLRRAMSVVTNYDKEYRFNYFECHRLNRDFSLVTPTDRSSILENLFEADKCFYQANYNIELYPDPPPKGWLEIASLSRLTNKVKGKLTELNYGDWDTQVYSKILAKEPRGFILGRIKELVHVHVSSQGYSK
jgi:hypothetical protein